MVCSPITLGYLPYLVNLFGEGIGSITRGFIRDRIVEFSNSYIECEQRAPDPNEVFDFPLPDGWLYKTFADDDNRYRSFDTGVSEYWVLPNVYCDSKHRLAAVSWMRSHENTSLNDSKGMDGRFRDSRPPFHNDMKLDTYLNRKQVREDKGGVFCDWHGWLYPLGDRHFHEWFDVAETESELFTFINVYCHTDNTVRFFAKAVAHKNQRGRDGIIKKSHLIYPFSYDNMHSVQQKVGRAEEEDYPRIECNWQGWLFNDMTKDTWQDDDGKRRHSYERYYAVGDDKDKFWMNGRVVNPFCSNDGTREYGIVTELRAYCFYTSKPIEVDNKRYYLKNRCSDLQKPDSQ